MNLRLLPEGSKIGDCDLFDVHFWIVRSLVRCLFRSLFLGSIVSCCVMVPKQNEIAMDFGSGLLLECGSFRRC